MNTNSSITTALAFGVTAMLLGVAAPCFALDVDAARALAKKSGCTKCHAVDKKKDGPSFKTTAAKYKDMADAEEKLFTHLTTSPKVKVDGNEEEHANPKTQDEAEIRNLIAYILSR